MLVIDDVGVAMPPLVIDRRGVEMGMFCRHVRVGVWHFGGSSLGHSHMPMVVVSAASVPRARKLALSPTRAPIQPAMG